jgi:cation diffusion facilitator family transporter
MPLSLEHSLKKRAAIVSVLSNLLLITLKLIVALLTGSLSILSESLHSLSDLLASIITFFSVKFSDEPPDSRHPYGHGKIENITASIEALLIIFAAIYILYEAFIRLFNPTPIDMPALGILVMFFSFLANVFVSTYLFRVSKKTQSLALEGDALHLRADMYSSLTMVVGFVLIWWFKWVIIDSVFAFAVAIYMLIEGYLLLKKSFNPLMDEAINDNDKQIILNVFKEHDFKIHDLKTRKSGNVIFADLHLQLDPDMPLKEAHKICDHIEEKLKEKLPGIDVTIHVEPL